MKAYRVVVLIVYALVPAYVVGCVTQDTQTAVPTAVPSSQPMRTPEMTLVPSAPAISPTLSAEDARARYVDLLSDNGECELPCLWGIAPEKSTVADAEGILRPLTSISYYTSLSGDSGRISPESIEGDTLISARVGFDSYTGKALVRRVFFDVKALRKTADQYQDVFDSTSFGKLANYYMLPSILTKYGPPESAWLSTQARPSSRVTTEGAFDLVLLYPDRGLFARYTTQMQLVGTNVQGCLSNAHVELRLYPSGKRDAFLQDVQANFWSQFAPDRYRALRDATAISIEEFYQMFRNSDHDCLKTPAALWPVPDK